MSHRRRLCRLVIGVDGLRVGDHDGYTEQPPACRVPSGAGRRTPGCCVPWSAARPAATAPFWRPLAEGKAHQLCRRDLPPDHPARRVGDLGDYLILTEGNELVMAD